MGAMYALAYVNNDIYTIVTEALKTIPEQSKFHRCITDVIKYWKQYPDDWRKCWLEIENRHAFEIGCPEGVFNAFNIDATINAAYCVMGLLYEMCIRDRLHSTSDRRTVIGYFLWSYMVRN